jgi:hypothetical protein
MKLVATLTILIYFPDTSLRKTAAVAVGLQRSTAHGLGNHPIKEHFQWIRQLQLSSLP